MDHNHLATRVVSNCKQLSHKYEIRCFLTGTLYRPPKLLLENVICVVGVVGVGGLVGFVGLDGSAGLVGVVRVFGLVGWFRKFGWWVVLLVW